MGDPGPSTQAYRDRLTVPSHSPARLTSHGHGQPHSPYRLTSTSPSWTPQTPATTRTIYDDAEGYVEVSLDTPDISAAYLEVGQSPQESKPKKFIPGFVRQLSRLPRSFHRNRRVPSEIKLETVPDAIRHTPQEGSIDPYSVYGPSMIPPPPTTRYIERFSTSRGSPTDITYDLTTPSAPGPQPPLAQIPPLSIGTPIEFPQPQVATPPESSHPNIQPPKKLRPHTSSKSSSRVPKSNQPSREASDRRVPHRLPVAQPPPDSALLAPEPGEPPAIAARPPRSPDYRKMGSPNLPGLPVTITQSDSNVAGEPSFSTELHPIQKMWKDLNDLPWVSPGRITVSYRPGLARGGMAVKVSRNGKKRLVPKPTKTWYPKRGVSSLWNASSVGGSLKGVRYMFSPAMTPGETATVEVLSSPGSHSARSRGSRRRRRSVVMPNMAVNGDPMSPRSAWSSTTASSQQAVPVQRHLRNPRRRTSTPYVYSVPLVAAGAGTGSPRQPSRRSPKKRRKDRLMREHELASSPSPVRPPASHDAQPLFPQPYFSYQPYVTPPLSFVAPVPPPFSQPAASGGQPTPSPVYFLNHAAPPTPPSTAQDGGHIPAQIITPVYFQMVPVPSTTPTQLRSGTPAVHHPSTLGLG